MTELPKLQTNEKESSQYVESLANLLEQRQAVAALDLDDIGGSMATQFPDLKVSMQCPWIFYQIK